MDLKAAKEILAEFQGVSIDAYETSKTASSNKKSLSGDNFYGRKFHDIVVALTKLELDLRSILARLPSDDADLAVFSTSVATLKSPTAKPSQKNEALKHIKLMCQTKLLNYIDGLSASPIPSTEQVLPLAVVD